MKFKIVSLLLIVLLTVSIATAEAPKVNEYLRMVAAGKIDEVKMKLPDLLAEYPDDPGVLLLHGVVIDDAYRAVDIYQSIIKKYPDSEWADDAFWRIIQFYAVTGDTSQAKTNLQKLRQTYPTSEYLAPATDIVTSAIKFARIAGKSSIERKSEYKVAEKEVKSVEKETKIPEKAIEKPKVADAKPDKSDIIIEVKKETKPEPAKTEPAKVKETGFWGLQVGIYRTKDKAEIEKENYIKQRMRTEVLQKTVDDEVMYAVVIGNYTSKESAESAKQIVEQQCGCKPIVFKK